MDKYLRALIYTASKDDKMLTRTEAMQLFEIDLSEFGNMLPRVCSALGFGFTAGYGGFMIHIDI